MSDAVTAPDGAILKDGDLAIVRFKNDGSEHLAQLCTDRHEPMYQETWADGMEPCESWALFGTELDFRIDEVEVVRRMYLTEKPC